MTQVCMYIYFLSLSMYQFYILVMLYQVRLTPCICILMIWVFEVYKEGECMYNFDEMYDNGFD